MFYDSVGHGRNAQPSALRTDSVHIGRGECHQRWSTHMDVGSNPPVLSQYTMTGSYQDLTLVHLSMPINVYVILKGMFYSDLYYSIPLKKILSVCTSLWRVGPRNLLFPFFRILCSKICNWQHSVPDLFENNFMFLWKGWSMMRIKDTIVVCRFPQIEGLPLGNFYLT